MSTAKEMAPTMQVGATQKDTSYPANFTVDATPVQDESAQRAAVLAAAKHLRVPLFRGANASKPEAELYDITGLWLKPSQASDPKNAKAKHEGWAITAYGELPKQRAGFKPSQMILLNADIDEGNLSATTVVNHVRTFFGSHTVACIYSTASSLPNDKRWRIVVPLSAPVGLDSWQLTMQAFAAYMHTHDVTLDTSMQRASQLAFTPNVPPHKRDPFTGKPLHFEHGFWGCELLDPDTLNTPSAMAAFRSVAEVEKRAAAEQDAQRQLAQQKAAERLAQRQLALANGCDGLTPIEKFNLSTEVESLLRKYGYTEDESKPGNWRSPYQASGSFATMVRPDGSWYSFSGSDAAKGLGTPQKNGVGGDAFDLYSHFEHGGDKKTAVKAAAQLLGMPLVAKPVRADLSAFTGAPLPQGVPRPFGGLGSPLLAFNGAMANGFTNEFEHSGDGKGFTASRSNLERALLAGDFCHRVGFDKFKCQVMICEPGETEWRPLRDTDTFNIALCLEVRGFKPISRETLRDAIGAVAERNTFDSAQQWLSGLQWDGVARVDDCLARGFATEAGAYQRAISRYIWTALAGRIIRPGTKADMVPVAVGVQGCRKSSAVTAIAPRQDFFGELDLSLDEADLFRTMKGKLVLELGELAGMRRKEAEHLKRFVAATHNVWVEKWQTATTSYARRSIFFGTTNDDSFLSDPTGSRRWLPFNAGVTGNCDPDWISANRDQLFAEGAHLYNTHGVLFSEAEQLAKTAHGDYAATDPWDDVLDAWVDRPGVDGVIPSSRPITTSDALRLGLGLSTAQINRGFEMRAGASLQRLGYKRVQRRIEGRRGWVYVKPS